MLQRLKRAMRMPALLALRTPAGEVIARDLERFVHHRKHPRPTGPAAFVDLFTELPEFRTLTYYRLRGAGGPALLLAIVLKRLYGQEDTLYLVCSRIGPGLFIQHGFATIVDAEEIGANCWIGHCVTVGNDEAGRRPILHDNVRVYPNSMVVGPVVLHERVRVAAMAYVNRDVGPGLTVAGIPARPLA